MRIRSWQGALVFWLHIAGSAAWLLAALLLIRILFKWAVWGPTQ